MKTNILFNYLPVLPGYNANAHLGRLCKLMDDGQLNLNRELYPESMLDRSNGTTGGSNLCTITDVWAPGHKDNFTSRYIDPNMHLWVVYVNGHGIEKSGYYSVQDCIVNALGWNKITTDMHLRKLAGQWWIIKKTINNEFIPKRDK